MAGPIISKVVYARCMPGPLLHHYRFNNNINIPSICCDCYILPYAVTFMFYSCAVLPDILYNKKIDPDRIYSAAELKGGSFTTATAVTAAATATGRILILSCRR